MLRFIVMLKAEDRNRDDERHEFSTWEEAERFAIKNKYRYIECYSEEKKMIDKTEFWQRHATYNIYADPNK